MKKRKKLSLENTILHQRASKYQIENVRLLKENRDLKKENKKFLSTIRKLQARTKGSKICCGYDMLILMDCYQCMKCGHEKCRY